MNIHSHATRRLVAAIAAIAISTPLLQAQLKVTFNGDGDDTVISGTITVNLGTNTASISNPTGTGTINPPTVSGSLAGLSGSFDIDFVALGTIADNFDSSDFTGALADGVNASADEWGVNSDINPFENTFPGQGIVFTFDFSNLIGETGLDLSAVRWQNTADGSRLSFRKGGVGTSVPIYAGGEPPDINQTVTFIQPLATTDEVAFFGIGTGQRRLREFTLNLPAPPAAVFEVDASADTDADSIWENTVGTSGAEFVLDTANGVARVPVTGSVTTLTNAYDFPGGLTADPAGPYAAEGGIGAAKLVAFGGSGVTAECLSFRDVAEVNDAEKATLEFWIRPDNINPGATNGQIIWEDGGATGWGLFVKNFEIRSDNDNGNDARISYNLSTDPLGLLLGTTPTSEYIQVVLTRVPSTGAQQMFINGQLVGSASDDTGANWSGGDGTALAGRGEVSTGGQGNGDDGTESFDGKIALFRIYQQILTPAQVLANFDALTLPTLVEAELTPQNGTLDFFAGSNLVAVFSEGIELVDGGTVTIKNLDASTEMVITLPDARITSPNGNDLVINPTADLGFSTNYAIQISADAVKDAPGNFFAGILNDTTWSFTTLPVDTTAPVVTDLSPANSSDTVVPGSALVAIFDEAIMAASVNITIKNLTDMTDDVITGSQVSIVDKTLTITPNNPLIGGKLYAVRIAGGAIENLTGLAFGGINDDSTWSFETISETTMTANSNWVGGTWDLGEPVVGVDAVIAAGVSATASGSVGTWSGDLTMNSGSVLSVSGTGGEFIALDGAANVAMDGSVLFNNFKSQTITSNFALSNGARFNISGTSAYNQDQTFSGNFTGTGGFTIIGRNHQGMRFTGTNTFTGGWIIENQAQRFGVEFGATGSAGSGDVTVEGNADGTGQGAVIVVNALNPFNTSATLTLNSNGFDNSSGGFGPFQRFLGTEIRIEMLNDATVGALIIDNVPQPAGEYTDDSGTWISGSGTLTVAGIGGFGSWIAGTFAGGATVSDQTPEGDDDNDGISNLLEYAIAGLDPTVPDASIGTFTGLTLSFDKRQTPPVTGITYAIEQSTDLGMPDLWEEVAATEDSNSISYTLPGSNPKDFLRLRVTQP